MGTDIHTHIMRRNKHTDEWETLKLYTKKGDKYEEAYTLVDNRNYALFGKLAGVRTFDEPLAPMRGWPKDLPADTQEWLDKYGEDMHSLTWYDYMELKALANTPAAISDYWDDDEDSPGYNVVADWLQKIDMILDAYYVWPQEPGEVRILIAFDS